MIKRILKKRKKKCRKIVKNLIIIVNEINIQLIQSILRTKNQEIHQKANNQLLMSEKIII